MREIKFRAWSKPFKEMLSCSYDNQYKDCRFMPYGYGLGNESLIVMQYTGLKDKNGKEIYEGDIVIAIAEDDFKDDTRTCDVIYTPESSFCVRSGKEYDCGLSLAWGGWESFEIIGNIYETPDLLK